jgi:hypothetical protein
MFFEKLDVQLRIQCIYREKNLMAWRLKVGADFLGLQQSVVPKQRHVDPKLLLDPDAAQHSFP